MVAVSSEELSYIRNPQPNHLLSAPFSSVICFKNRWFLETQVPIKLDVISNQALESNDFFDGCINCGHLYYEGAHRARWDNFVKQLQLKYNC